MYPAEIIINTSSYSHLTVPHPYTQKSQMRRDYNQRHPLLIHFCYPENHMIMLLRSLPYRAITTDAPSIWILNTSLILRVPDVFPNSIAPESISLLISTDLRRFENLENFPSSRPSAYPRQSRTRLTVSICASSSGYPAFPQLGPSERLVMVMCNPVSFVAQITRRMGRNSKCSTPRWNVESNTSKLIVRFLSRSSCEPERLDHPVIASPARGRRSVNLLCTYR